MTAKQAPEGVGGPTPGPWVVRESLDMTGDIGIIARGDLIAECFAAIRTHDEKSPEVRANAQLIAAAPELLEALVQAREALDFDCTGFPRMEERLIHWANKIAGPRGGESFHPDPVILSEICADIAKEVLPQIDAALRKARGQ